MKAHPPWLVELKSVAAFQNRIQGLGQMYNICAGSVIKGFSATNLFFLSLIISLISIFVLPIYSSKAWYLISAVGGSTGQGEGTKAHSKSRFKLFFQTRYNARRLNSLLYIP